MECSLCFPLLLRPMSLLQYLPVVLDCCQENHTAGTISQVNESTQHSNTLLKPADLVQNCKNVKRNFDYLGEIPYWRIIPIEVTSAVWRPVFKRGLLCEQQLIQTYTESNHRRNRFVFYPKGRCMQSGKNLLKIAAGFFLKHDAKRRGMLSFFYFILFFCFCFDFSIPQ